MKLQSTGPILSTVFVDYDNIYLSLKRKNEEAAKRFAKDAALWLKEIETGRLLTPTNAPSADLQRRIVMTRCYGNPVPRRNNQDNATDMNSFPFVRHHFLRAGFEVIDCPPLTAQLKNSADIRMVMDVRDYLTHETYFDEFIILSGDADFTPVLHRLRAHARRTVIFANDYTATPYTAISDGEVREADLISLLVEGRITEIATSALQPPAIANGNQLETTRRQILAEVTAAVRSAGQPLPLEALADRAIRALGHDKTVGSSWGGAGSFRDLLAKGLSEPMRLSEQPPYLVFEAPQRQAAIELTPDRIATAPPTSAPAPMPAHVPAPPPTERGASYAVAPAPAHPQLSQQAATASRLTRQMPDHVAAAAPRATQPATPARATDGATAIQQSIARIHEACQAPPLSPPEYRLLFDVLAQELNAHPLNGAQTLSNVIRRAQDHGAEFRRDDVRFVIDVVSETDPWFEQGASANLFAGRFRNFVVARCRAQGLNLSGEELELIDAWFAGQAAAPAAPRRAPPGPAPRDIEPRPIDNVAPQESASEQRGGGERWWNIEDERQLGGSQGDVQRFSADGDGGDEFPRIVRSRVRG